LLCQGNPVGRKKLKLHFSKNITDITNYEPGQSPEELNRELGITHAITLASNENPWGPSPAVAKALSLAMTTLHRYPDTSACSLSATLARNIGVSLNEIVLGNGSKEVMELLLRVFIRTGCEVITSCPSSLLYQRLVQIHGGKNIIVPLRRLSHDLDRILTGISDRTRLILFDNPTNPTGTAITPVELYSFLSEVPEGVTVVLDESYVEFMDQEKQVDIFSLVRNTKNRCGVVVVRTFSKAYGLAGLRIGYGVMPEEIAACLQKVRQPFNVNHLAQIAALAALEDENYLRKTLERTRIGKEYLREEVKKLGCTSYPSQTNFLLIDVKSDATRLYQAMLGKGVIVRPMNLYGFADCIRINVGTDEENTRFLAVLAECLSDLEDA
jgi:histidinol-phosphate aminotransferase